MGVRMMTLVREITPGPAEVEDGVLAHAAAGDRVAAGHLVARYERRVFALVSRMLAGRDRAVVEDVAQDTFLDVLRRLKQFDPRGPAKLSTWILTIAARRAIDELRRRRPEPLADIELPGGVRPDASARRRELLAALDAALAELSPELRAAFLLREYHGLDYAEIATALAIDLGTVKSRLSRARAALRAALEEVKDD
jgi:RNA polymerase sigma-70 factor (ECF subfamily)